MTTTYSERGPNTSTSRLLLTAKEAAYSLSISERKLWELTDDGRIPYIRIDRSVRYSVEDLARWIEEHRKGGE